jgi:hypothetical protein
MTNNDSAINEQVGGPGMEHAMEVAGSSKL